MDQPTLTEVRDSIYLRLSRKAPLPLPGMEATMKAATFERAIRLASFLFERADRIDECSMCCESSARKSISSEVYDSPFDNEGKTIYFCSEECQERNEDSYYGSFSYKMCDGCYRLVCERNPRNGWHEHFRYLDDEGVQYCLRCYEEHLFEHGVSRESFEAGKINGMFFNRGNPEAADAGYEEVDGFRYFFISNQASVERYCQKGMSLIDEGYKIITGYENMGIGGSEGSVTMLAKKEGKQ